MRNGALRSVIQIGLITGTLDISDALVFNAFRHVSPVKIFQYIASGLTGMWAFHAGMVSVALGVAIHYAIAMFWTVLYWVASGRMPVLVRRPVVCGLLYGGLVYVVMNFAVLPLTRVARAHGPAPLASQVNGVLALLLCIGLTVAWLTRKQRLAGSVERMGK
jgi:hypothetical protein